MPKPPAETGLRAYLAGASAEEQAVRAYEAQGYELVEQRWRGAGGEIDLILQKASLWVFVEVKTGPSHAAALARITPRQMARVAASAALFLDQQPEGGLSEARIDVAVVDSKGSVEILENAYGQG
ncbi:YraN family protein [Pseudophaeobacter sp.]|uniref:YraN family protein n=1 Tax=Pseudophaeobacter sp. TaxID=1971739 RepID=UPI0032999AA1